MMLDLIRLWQVAPIISDNLMPFFTILGSGFVSWFGMRLAVERHTVRIDSLNETIIDLKKRLERIEDRVYNGGDR